jgi:hypothetical protein
VLPGGVAKLFLNGRVRIRGKSRCGGRVVVSRVRIGVWQGRKQEVEAVAASYLHRYELKYHKGVIRVVGRPSDVPVLSHWLPAISVLRLKPSE